MEWRWRSLLRSRTTSKDNPSPFPINVQRIRLLSADGTAIIELEPQGGDVEDDAVICRRSTMIGIASLLATTGSKSQGWPSRPIRIVVPVGPGNSSDLMARLLVEPLRKALGQPVIIENRAGAGGTIGTEYAVRQPADGHTLLMAISGATAIAPSLYTRLGYNPATDFAPIALTATVPQLFLVPAASPIRSIEDLVSTARRRPKELTYGSGGVGSTQHLNAALFSSLTGTEFVHVPYRSSADNLNDLMGGRLDFSPETLTGALGFVTGGTLRALAVTSKERSPFFPTVPTMEEAGVPGYEAVGWMGLVAPAQVPSTVVSQLVEHVSAAMALPEVLEGIRKIAMTPTLLKANDFAAFIQSETQKWGNVVRASGARIEN